MFSVFFFHLFSIHFFLWFDFIDLFSCRANADHLEGRAGQGLRVDLKEYWMGRQILVELNLSQTRSVASTLMWYSASQLLHNMRYLSTSPWFLASLTFEVNQASLWIDKTNILYMNYWFGRCKKIKIQFFFSFLFHIAFEFYSVVLILANGRMKTKKWNYGHSFTIYESYICIYICFYWFSFICLQSLWFANICCIPIDEIKW